MPKGSSAGLDTEQPYWSWRLQGRRRASRCKALTLRAKVCIPSGPLLSCMIPGR